MRNLLIGSELALILIALFITAHKSYAQDKPDWVITRPISSTHYIGIGVVQKTQDDQNYHDIARNLALKDISSEIASYISSETDHTIIEKAGLIYKDFKSKLTSSTNVHLEDYQLIDTWENDDELWVQYRLSKELFLNKRKLRLEKAKELSFDLYKKAKNHQKKRNFAQSVLLYLKSYYVLQDFITEPLKVSYQNKKINLESNIYTSLQELLNKIYISAQVSSYDVKVGQSYNKPIQFSAYYMDLKGKKIPLPNLPLKFSFIKGSGQLIEETITNENGLGECKIIKVSPNKVTQIVQCEINTDNFKEKDLNFIQQNLVEKLLTPKAQCQLNTINLSVFIITKEIHFGDQSDIQYLEPIVKKVFSNNNIYFTADSSKADFLLELNAISRKGANSYDLFTAYVDLTISLIDLKQQVEVYSKIQSNVKGIELDYIKAELSAFRSAGKKIKNILPELIDIIQN
jgi:hypothetical protein